MKPIIPGVPDPVEKELKSLIDRINSENAALNKILTLVELKEADQIRDASGETEAEKTKENNKTK